MIAIVTGAAGFIGSHLCQALLDAGHYVLGIDCFTPYYARDLKEQHLAPFRHHPRFALEERDLCDPQFAIPSHADVVFHLAAQPGVRPSWGEQFPQYLHHNVAATQSLLEALRREPAGKLIYASSSSIYGSRTGRVSETASPHPRAPYAVSKLAAEHLCTAYAEAFRIPSIILRLFTVFGPGQRPDMAFSRFIDAVLRDQPVMVFGDGRQTRNVTHVQDAVAAMLLAAASPLTNTVFNIAGAQSTSMLQAIDIIGATLGLKPRVRHVEPAPGESRANAANIGKARALLHYVPRHTVREGLCEQVLTHRATASRGTVATARADP
jgi:nucleoside-diphosphate-sugar epimerase